MPSDIRKLEIEEFVLRALIGREMHGYEIIGELKRMGINSGHNYVYTILANMERRGSLTGRWEGNRTRRPSRHFYRLSEQGRQELDTKVRDAVDLIMALFLSRAPMGSPRTFERICSKLGAPLPKGRLVIAASDCNPAVSLQLYAHRLIGDLPGANVYLVKPPDLRFHLQPTGATVLDGRRDNLPFKDEFADSLFLLGIPSYASEEKTLNECARVLNRSGSLLVKQPNTLTTDRAPRQITGYEYFGKLFYEIYDRDKTVSIGELIKLLSNRFETVKDGVFGGSTWLYAHAKRGLPPHG